MEFFTTIHPTESEYKESSSKFLSFSFPINSEESAKRIIKEFQKKYFDATHVCFAYALGNHDLLKAHDAGEPSHTAGSPILNAIRSKQLTNILVVVVRYFGGTKLGKSGLIQAYKSAANACLENAAKILFVQTAILSCEISYDKLHLLIGILKQKNCNIIDKQIGNVCTVSFEVPMNIRNTTYRSAPSI